MIIKKIAEKERALCIQMIPQTEEDRTLCADLQVKGFLDEEGKNALFHEEISKTVFIGIIAGTI